MLPLENEDGQEAQEEFSFDNVDFGADLESELPNEKDSAPEDGDTPALEEPDGDEKVPPQEAAPQPSPEQPAPQANIPEDIMRVLARQLELNQQQAQPKEEPKEDAPKYNLTVHDKVLGLMRSEDPGEMAQGFNAFATQIANMVYQDAIASVTQMIEQQYAPQFMEMVQQQSTSQQQQQRVQQDYYAKYPELNNPAGKQLSAFVASQIINQYKQQGKPVAWSPQLMEEIGNGVKLMLKSAAGEPQKKPGFRPTPGARPAAKPTTKGDEIMSVVNSF